jgi:hypothetical protein
MGRGRINEKFFGQKPDKPRKKIIVILNMKCAECEYLNELRNLETDSFCKKCDNKIVEYQKNN